MLHLSVLMYGSFYLLLHHSATHEHKAFEASLMEHVFTEIHWLISREKLITSAFTVFS